MSELCTKRTDGKQWLRLSDGRMFMREFRNVCPCHSMAITMLCEKYRSRSSAICAFCRASGAVCLVATARCCLSGRYSQVLSLYESEVTPYFITAQNSTRQTDCFIYCAKQVAASQSKSCSCRHDLLSVLI
jgi:hypothetical protein